ncbi:hypothetical protein KKD61_03725 [Patescibacteria group bacterium]|nr:hypothetical protein [Patescibacteria group bacterium]
MTKKGFKKTGLTLFVSCFLFFVSCFLFLPCGAKAQNVVSLVAIPPRVEDVVANPGEVVTKKIKLQNQGEAELAVSARPIDFVVEDKEGTPVFLRENQYRDNRWALSGWVNISPSQFIVKPGESVEMDLIILVPEDALPGGHYAAVTYQPADTVGGDSATTSKIVPSVATLVYLTVSGEIKEDALIRRMDVPNFSEYGPIPFSTEIENLSDIHIRPTALIRVYNLFNRLSTTLSLGSQNIFPGQSRIYQNTWDKKWLFGRYKARLEGAFGTQGGSLLAVAYFWVIPWKLILIAVLVITLIILAIVYWRKKRRVEIKQPEIEEGASVS